MILSGRKKSDDLIEAYEGLSEIRRMEKVTKNTRVILDNLDKQFCKQTGLTKNDMVFLFTAIGLQIVRQYLVTNFPERIDDQLAVKKTWFHNEEHSNRKHRYYNPSLEEIITNPVPFDANIGANGALKGGGKMGHRVTAIGHDPVLGLIFGTANIATSTLTTSDFKSYHIYTNANNRDCFKNHAQTELVISYTIDKLMHKGAEGKKIVAVSLMKEIVHLNSDLNTKNSLPLPVVSAVDTKLASDLASYGLDMSNAVSVGKQAVYANFINSIIAMIHQLFYDGISRNDRKLFEVRTRKILCYSNLVASSSNIIMTAATQNVQLFDFGGLAITVYRLITDKDFIRNVKEEFIFGTYRDLIKGI